MVSPLRRKSISVHLLVSLKIVTMTLLAEGTVLAFLGGVL